MVYATTPGFEPVARSVTVTPVAGLRVAGDETSPAVRDQTFHATLAGRLHEVGAPRDASVSVPAAGLAKPETGLGASAKREGLGVEASPAVADQAVFAGQLNRAAPPRDALASVPAAGLAKPETALGESRKLDWLRAAASSDVMDQSGSAVRLNQSARPRGASASVPAAALVKPQTAPGASAKQEIAEPDLCSGMEARQKVALADSEQIKAMGGTTGKAATKTPVRAVAGPKTGHSAAKDPAQKPHPIDKSAALPDVSAATSGGCLSAAAQPAAASPLPHAQAVGRSPIRAETASVPRSGSQVGSASAGHVNAGGLSAAGTGSTQATEPGSKKFEMFPATALPAKVEHADSGIVSGPAAVSSGAGLIVGSPLLANRTLTAATQWRTAAPELAVPGQPAQPGDARTLQASANTLEVGLASGTHGWLRVRAELSQSGVVTAAVVASSASSAEALNRHLPEMSQYLAQASTQIGSIVVHASSSGGALPGSSDGTAGAMQSGMQERSGNPDRRGDQGAPTRPGAERDSPDSARTEQLGTMQGFWPALPGSPGPVRTGSSMHWVNVHV